MCFIELQSVIFFPNSSCYLQRKLLFFIYKLSLCMLFYKYMGNKL